MENQCLINGLGGLGRRLGLHLNQGDSRILANIFRRGMEDGIRSSKYYFQVLYCKQMPQKVVFFSEYVSQSVNKSTLYVFLVSLTQILARCPPPLEMTLGMFSHSADG